MLLRHHRLFKAVRYSHRYMTSGSTTKVKENINPASSTTSAKRHIKPTILSATLLSLADTVGAVGGGFSAAIVMAQRATGLSTEAAAYSTSLGLLPLCLGYTVYGLLEDDAKEKISSDDDETTNNNNSDMMNSQVYWPGALAFATTATIVGKGSRLLIGLWSPLPTGVKLDAKLLQTHPILRTSSNGLLSIVIIAAGSSSLLRSYQQYTTTTRNIEKNDGSNVIDVAASIVNGKDRGDTKKETSSYTYYNGVEKTPNSLWHIFSRQITTQFQEIEEDENNNNYVRQYAMAGGISHLRNITLSLYHHHVELLYHPLPVLVISVMDSIHLRMDRRFVTGLRLQSRRWTYYLG